MSQAPAPLASDTQTNQPRQIKFMPGLLKPGSLSHFLLWKEGSGLTFSLILALCQWGIPLHLRSDWKWEMAVLAVAGAILSAWYPSAQSNAVQYAMRDEGQLDSQQPNRDFGLSILPALVIGAMYLLTTVGLCLVYLPTGVFDDPNSWWVRDRLIISPVMAVYSIIVLWMVKVDIGNNNTVLTQVVQLAGRLRRFEHMN